MAKQRNIIEAAPEAKGLPEGWAWSDLLARRLAGSELAYALAQDFASDPKAHCADLLLEAASTVGWALSDLTAWIKEDASHFYLVADCQKGAAERGERMSAAEVLEAVTEYRAIQLENAIEGVNRASLVLCASMRLSFDGTAERLALSPQVIECLSKVECNGLEHRFCELDQELGEAIAAALFVAGPGRPLAMSMAEASQARKERTGASASPADDARRATHRASAMDAMHQQATERVRNLSL